MPSRSFQNIKTLGRFFERLYNASGMMAHIQAMDAEERDSFLDGLMLADEQGF